VEKGATKADELYRCAADAGHACMILSIGHPYVNGDRREKGAGKGVELFACAIDAGNSMLVGWAMFKIGNHYNRGVGVEKDASKAVEVYTSTADAGHAGAMNNLGVRYERRDRVEMNPSSQSRIAVHARR
jgi:uncharacterized protein